MLPGEAKEEDIIRSVRRGIYAQSFTNGQVQIGAGDFTFFMKTGYLIEDGHLTRPLRLNDLPLNLLTDRVACIYFFFV